jgi:hypothetical protein
VEATPVTLSEKVTVHCTADAFVGDAPTRPIETTVGALVSTVQEYDVGSLVDEPETARTWNVCGASDNPLYDFELGRAVPQFVNGPPSSEHSKRVIACESV